MVFPLSLCRCDGGDAIGSLTGDLVSRHCHVQEHYSESIITLMNILVFLEPFGDRIEGVKCLLL